jgi:hypothetical protein
MSFHQGNTHSLPQTTFEPYEVSSSPVAIAELPAESNLPTWSDPLSQAWKKGRDALYRAWATLIRDRAAGKAFDESKAVQLMRSLNYTPDDLAAAVAGRQQREAWAEVAASLPAAEEAHRTAAQRHNDLLKTKRARIRAIDTEIAEARQAASVAQVELERVQAVVRNLRLGKPVADEIGLRDSLARLQRERDSHQEIVDAVEKSIVELEAAIKTAPTEAAYLNAQAAAGSSGTTDLPGISAGAYTKEHLRAALDLQRLRLKDAQVAVAAADAKIKPLAARLAEIEREQLLP